MPSSQKRLLLVTTFPPFHVVDLLDPTTLFLLTSLAMHRLARLPRVVQALHGSRYRYGVQPLARTLATAAAPSPNDPFANGTNTYYAEEMYRLWRQDPKSVHASWDVYFSGMDKGLPSYKAFQPPPTIAPADGAPALHAHGGTELDDHLKVRICMVFFWGCAQLQRARRARSNSSSAHTKCAATTLPTSTPSVSSTRT